MAMTGSQIAKGGFENEQCVADKFNNWQNDADAQQWLRIMMYNLDEIEYVQKREWKIHLKFSQNVINCYGKQVVREYYF